MMTVESGSPNFWLETAKIVIPALIAGVGAWLGGGLSISREMEKLRNERAFDHRLDWYRRAARGIVEYQWFLIDLSKASEAGDVARAKELVAKREATKVAQEADAREMTLFASPATIAALNRANTRAASAIKSSSLSTVEAAQTAERELDNAYFVLANDVREHLGMSALTLHELKAMTPDFCECEARQRIFWNLKSCLLPLPHFNPKLRGLHDRTKASHYRSRGSARRHCGSIILATCVARLPLQAQFSLLSLGLFPLARVWRRIPHPFPMVGRCGRGAGVCYRSVGLRDSGDGWQKGGQASRGDHLSFLSDFYPRANRRRLWSCWPGVGSLG